MCKAIEDLKAESMAEGMAEGMAKGRAEGRAEGILSTLTDLVRKGLLTITQAAQQANMTEQEFMEKAGLKQ